MIRDVFAGVIAAGLLWLAARLATNLHDYRRERQRALDDEEALGRMVIAEIPGERDLVLFTEDAARFYYGDRAIDKDLILSAALVVNGTPVSQVGSLRGRDPGLNVGQAAPAGHREAAGQVDEEEADGIRRDRWDVRIETVNGVIVVACGAIRERISQELARAVFDAVGRGIHHSASGAPPP